MKKNTLLVATLTAAIAVAVPDMAYAAEDYTVQKGDSLWKIAKNVLGDGSKYMEIYDNNKDVIADPRLIHPGQNLKLDAGTTTATADTTSKKEKFIVVEDDTYQLLEVNIGVEYTIEKEPKIYDCVIVFDHEVAEVTDTTIVPKKNGAGTLFVIGNDGTVEREYSMMSIASDATGIWGDSDHYVPVSAADKTVASAESSDEKIAKAVLKGNDVHAVGCKAGDCYFKVTYDDGTHESVKITVVEPWENVLEQQELEARKILNQKCKN